MKIQITSSSHYFVSAVRWAAGEGTAYAGVREPVCIRSDGKPVASLFHPRRVAGEHCCSPAPSERHGNLSVYAAQASLKAPRGTRWGADASPARYWSGADQRNPPEAAPAARLPSSALPPESVVRTVSCGDTRGKSARFRGG